VLDAVRLFTNQAGFGVIAISPWSTERGNGRNGPRTIVRSGASSNSALCTTPMPLCTPSSVCPGNAPQLAAAVRKPKAVHALTATER
jgi:hypothetical protein